MVGNVLPPAPGNATPPTCTAPQTLVNGVCTNPPLLSQEAGNGGGVASCTDGIQNQDETGIDTGGVCAVAE